MLRVLFILPRFNRTEWGATESLVWNLVKALVNTHLVQCEIVSFQIAEEQPAEETVAGIPIHRFKVAEKRRLRWREEKHLPAELQELDVFLKKNRFDLVHHFLTGRWASFLVLHLAGLGIPYIMHCRSRDFQMEPKVRRFFQLLWRRRMRAAKPRLAQVINFNHKALVGAELLLTTGAELQKTLMNRLPSCRVECFAPGVDFEYFKHPSSALFRSFYQIPQEQPMLLSAGRLSEQNNQKFLLEVLSVLNRRTHRCRLVLLGRDSSPDGKYLNSLLEMAKDRGVSEYVTVVPGLPPGDDRYRAAYQAASAVLLPSRGNVEGTSVLEAWAAGVPVIAAPNGEAADLIEDGINGRLAGIHQFTDWVSGTETFLDERLRSMQERLRAAASERAREFDWSHRAGELLKIYESVIEQYKKRRHRKAVQEPKEK